MEVWDKELEKLKNREITPSNNAWFEIEHQLNGKAKRKRKRLFFYAVAASFLLGVVLTGLFNRSQDVPVTDVVQPKQQPEENTIKKLIEGKPQFKSADELKQLFPQQGLSETTEQKQNKSDFNAERPLIRKEKLNKSLPVIAQAEEKIANEIQPDHMLPLLPQEKVQLTTAHWDEAQIEAALQKALVQMEQQKESKIYSVDANALLQEVERELDVQFREKIYYALEKRIENIKNAIVKL
ncbi:hypothetical protein [Mesonia sp. HuA40]|uniref:hypothetical protein n=1 Tax=Mesonia sp. HuA40 TaxID=2602761 RepID=UPI0011C7BC90|nr:hypothetical protein [Mesonia sp. HuA40]TXK73706.1 hypothetical protein FT993_05190 [Mesonia sp. HuA40]